MSLDVLLAGPPEALVWSADGVEVIGPEVLPVARPGLALRVGGEVILVPHGVFHLWIEAVAIRVLRQYVRFGQKRDHEVDWMVRAVAGIRLAAAPPSEADALALGLYPGGFAGLEATLRILSVVHGDRPDPMEGAVAWIRAAHRWATKRHTGDRRCAEDPPALLRAAADAIAAIDGHGGEAPALSRAAEIERQWRELPEHWVSWGA